MDKSQVGGIADEVPWCGTTPAGTDVSVRRSLDSEQPCPNKHHWLLGKSTENTYCDTDSQSLRMHMKFYNSIKAIKFAYPSGLGSSKTDWSQC